MSHTLVKVNCFKVPLIRGRIKSPPNFLNFYRLLLLLSVSCRQKCITFLSAWLKVLNKTPPLMLCYRLIQVMVHVSHYIMENMKLKGIFFGIYSSHNTITWCMHHQCLYYIRITSNSVKYVHVLCQGTISFTNQKKKNLIYNAKHHRLLSVLLSSQINILKSITH